MIHSYRFRNFFSFAEETEVSFAINRQAPDSDLVFESESGARLSKLMAVIGPNASGKTNALKPLSFLRWFVAYSFVSPEDELPIRTHFFVEDGNSDFKIDFEVEGQRFRYALVINSQRVVHESLHHKTSKFFSFIFRRDWSVTDSTYEISQQNFGFASREAEKVRQNASLLATAAQYNVPLAKMLVNYFKGFRSNVIEIGRMHRKVEDLFQITDFYHDRPALWAQMSEILGDLDLGLAEISIESQSFLEKDSGNEKQKGIPFGIHRKGKHEKKLPIWFESSGTQAALVLMHLILPAFEHGGLVIVDELEADLHPHMITAILELFIDPERNPHNAQMIFTSHAHEVLDVLQKDQILFVEKDPDGFSEAWRLGDMKGIRRDDNLYAKYRAGAYGAVPDLVI